MPRRKAVALVRNEAGAGRTLDLVRFEPHKRRRCIIGKAHIALKLGQGLNLRGRHHPPFGAMRHEAHAIAGFMGADSDVFPALLDIFRTQRFGQEFCCIRIGCVEHDAVVEIANNRLRALVAIYIFQLREHLVADNEGPAELPDLSQALGQKGHPVQGRDLIHDEPDPGIIGFRTGHQCIGGHLETGRDDIARCGCLFRIAGQEDNPAGGF